MRGTIGRHLRIVEDADRQVLRSLQDQGAGGHLLVGVSARRVEVRKSAEVEPPQLGLRIHRRDLALEVEAHRRALGASEEPADVTRCGDLEPEGFRAGHGGEQVLRRRDRRPVGARRHDLHELRLGSRRLTSSDDQLHGCPPMRRSAWSAPASARRRRSLASIARWIARYSSRIAASSAGPHSCQRRPVRPSAKAITSSSRHPSCAPSARTRSRSAHSRFPGLRSMT